MDTAGKVTRKRRLALLCLALACGGCSPLVATIGFEADDDAEAPAPTDSGNSAKLDAAAAAIDAAVSLVDAGVSELSDAAATPVQCWHLPEIVNARNEAGIERVEEGAVFGVTDKEFGCLDGGGLIPSSDPVFVSYARQDAKPLMAAGHVYSLYAATGAGWVSLSYYAGERCTQSSVDILPLIGSPMSTLCRDVRPINDLETLRLPLSSNQTPFPAGMELCDTTCALRPKSRGSHVR